MGREEGSGLSRRALLGTSSLAAAGSALTGFGLGRLPASEAAPAAPGSWGGDILEVHGTYQRGILDDPQAHAVFLGMDFSWPENSAERLDLVRSVLRLITSDAERLTAGRGVLADSEAEMAAAPARLSLTVGLAKSVIESVTDRELPEWLGPLPAFGIDKLEEAYGQADLLIQFCCDDPITLHHAVRAVRKDLRTLATVKFEQHGFAQARGAQKAGAPMRNLFGQVDGTANPVNQEREKTVFGGGDSWIDGGTTLVLRRIEMDLDAWDEVDRPARDFALGRRQSDGSPLSGGGPGAQVDINATDDQGLLKMPPLAHAARAHPVDPVQKMHRRVYNYREGETAGLLFASYQTNVDRQFLPVQRRLDEADALNEWTTPVGSGVYAVLPGFAPGRYLGQGLFE